MSFDLNISEKGIYLSDVIQTIDNHVAVTVFPLIENDIGVVIFSAMNGALTDVYPNLETNNLNSVSIPLLCSKSAKDFNSIFVIYGIENLDNDNIELFYNETSMSLNFDIIASGFPPIILNFTASTLSKVRENIYSAIDDISFANLSYRKDIGKTKTCMFTY